MKALKLVYFADRYHLRKYGRPIVGDEWSADDTVPAMLRHSDAGVAPATTACSLMHHEPLMMQGLIVI